MTSVADLRRADYAHTNCDGTVIITRPAYRFPFPAPRMEAQPVTEPIHEPRPRDRSAAWLRNAMIGLAVLAIASATVSYAAQFVMVDAARKITFISALEAGIPDVGALIFASLGIALALHGRRAIRARVLNIGAVATSVFMNYAAAGHGWRDLAIWVMPPIAYALASDTAIGVVRAWAIARQKQLNEALAEDETTPLAMFGRLALYLLRLTVAPPSTLKGLRRRLLIATPLPAAVPAPEPQPAIASSPRPARSPRRARGTRPGKTARFLDLVVSVHGPLADFPVADVSKVAGQLAPAVDLHAGSARTALKAAVIAAQNGSQE